MDRFKLFLETRKDEFMDVLRLDLYFWQLAHTLVVEKGMKLLEVSKNEKEIIIEDEKNKQLIRLVRNDFDWSNHLKQDMQISFQKAELLRKHLSYRELNVQNIYLMMYPPVDSWEHLFQSPVLVGKAKRTKVVSMLVTPSNGDAHNNLQSVYQKFSIQQHLDEYDDEVIEIRINQLKIELKQKAKERLQAEKKLFTYGKPKITYILLLMIAIIFILLELNGGSMQISNLVNFGAKYNAYMEQGEWWRLITSMFLHIGWLHFIMNSLALLYLGSLVERIYGNWRFLVIYFIAGIIGSIASYAFNDHVAAGASGAIFGCFGALLYFGVIHQKLFFRTIGMNVIIIIALNLGFGFVIPMIDNSAHIGGLVGGFLAAAIVHLPKHKKVHYQWYSIVGTIVLTVGLLFFGLINDNKSGSPYIELMFAEELIQQENYDEAFPLLEKAVEKNNDLPEAYFLLAYAQAKTEQYESSFDNFTKSVELRDNFHEAHYNLALLYIEFEEYEKALDSVQKALSIHKNEDYESLEKKLLEHLRLQ